MRTLLLVVIAALCCVSSAIGQISFTMSDYAALLVPGKSWRTLASDDSIPVTMNVGIASTTQAQSWSVPTVTFVDTFRNDNVFPSTTPYASQFPAATHAQRYSMNENGYQSISYTYLRLANDSLVSLGAASRVITQGVDTTYFYLRPSLSALFPLRIGYSRTTRDSTNFGSGYSITTLTETIDAFGSLVSPAGTFQCLRLRDITISQVVIPGFPSTLDTSITLHWITKEGVSLAAFVADGAPASGTTTLEFLSYTTLISTPVSVAGDGHIPKRFELFQNYPNPFNPSTSFQFQVSGLEFVSIKVFDVLGREVAVLADEVYSPGTYKLTWDASAFPSGVYLYRLQAGNFVATRKMVLTR